MVLKIDCKDVLKLIGRILSKDNGESQALLLEARHRLNSIDPQTYRTALAEVEAEATRLISNNNSASALVARAMTRMLYGRGKWDNAERDFNRALELDSKIHSAHCGYAKLCLLRALAQCQTRNEALPFLNQAEKHLNQAFKLNEWCELSIYLDGVHAVACQEYSRAIYAFEKLAKSKNASNKERILFLVAYVNYTKRVDACENQKIREQVRLITKSFRNEPNLTAEEHLGCAFAEIYFENIQEAMHHFKIAADSNIVQGRINYGALLWNENKDDNAAAEQFEKALAIEPNNILAQQNLAVVKGTRTRVDQFTQEYPHGVEWPPAELSSWSSEQTIEA